MAPSTSARPFDSLHGVVFAVRAFDAAGEETAPSRADLDALRDWLPGASRVRVESTGGLVSVAWPDPLRLADMRGPGPFKREIVRLCRAAAELVMLSVSASNLARRCRWEVLDLAGLAVVSDLGGRPFAIPADAARDFAKAEHVLPDDVLVGLGFGT